MKHMTVDSFGTQAQATVDSDAVFLNFDFSMVTTGRLTSTAFARVTTRLPILSSSAFSAVLHASILGALLGFLFSHLQY